jgi:hypothetical protein
MKTSSRSRIAVAYRASGNVVTSPADARCRVGPSGRPGAPVCPLTTVGRKSGQRRTVPLLYLAVTT